MTRRSKLDHFIIGVLILYTLVFVSELFLLVPCGSWQAVPTCELPAAAKRFWGIYFEIDPLFAQMPQWYAAILSLQDMLYNPWWLVALFMFWTGRQEAGWFRGITLLVCGMLIATNFIVVFHQAQDPHYTVAIGVALALINGPWIAGPLLVAYRLRPLDRGQAWPYGTTKSALQGLMLMSAATLVYGVFCLLAIAIAT